MRPPAARGALALGLIAIMLVPSLLVLPPAEAFHTTPRELPRLPILRHDQSECLPTRLSQLPNEVRGIDSERAFWQWVRHEGRNVPALCVPTAEPALVEALHVLNAAVLAINEAMSVVENQTGYRQELYVPLNRTSFLTDTFEPEWPRVGGYGDWKVVSVTGRDSMGEPATFHPAKRPSAYAEFDEGWRFWDPATGTYPSPADVALVSPEIDLFAVDAADGGQCASKACLHQVRGPRGVWASFTSLETVGSLVEVLGQQLGVENYLKTWENQAAATLTIRHRYNLAQGRDGVRIELYESPPTRETLAAMTFEGPIQGSGRHILRPTNPGCEGFGSVPRHETLPTGCQPALGNFALMGQATTTPLTPPSEDRYDGTSQFSGTYPNAGLGFTGSTALRGGDDGWVDATFDLSSFAGKSVWIVFRVSTGIGEEGQFEDEGLFPVKGEYGYFLDSFNLTGKVKPHNVRVKGDDRTTPRTAHLADPNLKLANPNTGLVEQTMLPPMVGEDVEFYVTNFGRYVDDVRTTITVSRNGQTLDRVVQTKTLMPGEVWRAAYTWTLPEAKEGELYRFVVTAELESVNATLPPQNPIETNQSGVRVNNTRLEEDPFQPRNEAFYRVDRDNTATVDVRATRVRAIELLPLTVEGVTSLVPIHPPVDAKDQSRTVAIRVANTGNTAEHVRVVPSIDDGERLYPDFIVGDPVRELGLLAPGEERELQWTLRPYLSGAYRVLFAFQDSSVPELPLIDTSPARALYVGQTAGVVCQDDLAYRRECVPGWGLDDDSVIRGTDLHGAWISPSGALYVVGANGLVARESDGLWTDLRDADAVESPLTVLRNFTAVHGFGDDVLYVVGEKGTILRYDGAWQQVPITNPLPAVDGEQPPNPYLERRLLGVWGPDASRVFVVGEAGTLLQLNTTSGAFEAAKNVTAPLLGRDVTAITGSGSAAWAVGDRNLILRWDGRYWNATMRTGSGEPYVPAGAPSVALHAVLPLDSRWTLFGGDYGTVYLFDATLSKSHVTRHVPGAPRVTAFAAGPDGNVYALGAHGLLLRCDGCLAPAPAGSAQGNWTALTSAAPYITRDDSRPRVFDGVHGAKADGQPDVPRNGEMRFEVTYADPDGDPPSTVRVVTKRGNDAERVHELAWTGAGNYRDGARFSGLVTFSTAGTYTYRFVASDGATSAETPTSQFRVGRDCNTGREAANAPDASAAARLYPDHKDVVCGGALRLQNDGADHYNFVGTAGQTLHVWLNRTTPQPNRTIPAAIDFKVTRGSTVLVDTATTPPTLSPDRYAAVPLTVDGAYGLGITLSAGNDETYELVMQLRDAPSTSPFGPLESGPSTLQGRIAKAAVAAVATPSAGVGPVAVLEGGYLFRFWDGGLFENAGDWQPDHHLRPTGDDGTGKRVAWWGGGAGSSFGTLRAKPVAAYAPQSIASLTLKLDHFVAQAVPGEAVLQRHGQQPLKIRDYPELRMSFLVVPEQSHDNLQTLLNQCYGGRSETLCDASYEVIHTYRKAHPIEGWNRETFDLTPLLQSQQYVRPDTVFGGIDFYVPNADPKRPFMNSTSWAVDRIVLEATLTSGQTVTLVEWHGRDVRGNTSAYLSELPPVAGDGFASTAWQKHERPIYGRFGSPLRANDPGFSLWHLSKETDVPVWVSNFEHYRYAFGGVTCENCIGDAKGLQSILLTPAVDLRQVFDPVLEFKHVFNGRYYVDGCVWYYDVGSVWMQVWDERAQDWGRLHPLRPNGGYPTQGRGGALDHAACDFPHPQSPPTNWNGFRYGQGFVGRMLQPDSLSGVTRYSGVQNIENYQTVRIDLDHQGVTVDRELRAPAAAPPLVPKAHNEIVRFAFIHNASRFGDGGSDNAEHLGWHIADVRVLAERKLGNDLGVSDLDFRVGYDWRRIGVGPGTTVPVNVTVTNNGAFDVPGFRVRLAVSEVEDAARRATRVVATDERRYDANIVPGESRNFTLFWRLADLPQGVEAKSFIVTAVAIPLGRPDENDADNVASIGDFSSPVVAKVTRDVRVVVDADPRAESSSVKRYLPVYVDNLGNVPESGLVIQRTIVERRGSQGSIVVDSRTWTMRSDAVAPEGTRTILTAIADGVDPLRDLFWQPPAQANYLVTATLTGGVGSRIVRSEVAVESHTTYLFDDFEDGIRGTAFRGGWDAGAGWETVTGSGFGGSAHARRFGDASLGTYPASANASLALPTVDLSSASTSKLSFVHRYDFEEGYDGGVVEASTDGGRTWIPLVPEPSVRHGLPHGYPRVPLSPATVLDPANDPFKETFAFTGASRDLPGSLDGWIFTQVNLGQIKDLVRTTAYETFGAQEQRSDALRRCTFDGAACTGRPYYADGSWLVGPALEQRYFQLDNLHEDVLTPTHPGGFFWSGSPRLDDDGLAPTNTFLRIPVDLRTIDPNSQDKVQLRVREWLRHDSVTFEASTSPSFFILTPPTDLTPTTRTNWSREVVLAERDGNWWTWTVDLSELRGREFTLDFLFEPHTDQDLPRSGNPSEWGWIIDDVEVVSFRDSAGVRVQSGRFLSMPDAIEKAETATCGPRQAGTERRLPCIQRPPTSPYAPAKDAEPGTGWAVVTTIPKIDVAWSTIGLLNDEDRQYVKDMRDPSGAKTLPTGEESRVWWSGIRARHADGTPNTASSANVIPGADRRLVTPSVDLSRVAGETATLRFDQMYSFLQLPASQTGNNPGIDHYYDIGVIEVQVFDRATASWGEWRQLYKPLDPALCKQGLGDVKSGCRGGYPSAIPLTALGTSTFRPLWTELDLERHRNPDRRIDYVYGYTGQSTGTAGSFGWVEDEFDLSEYVGERVRLGFRYITVIGQPNQRDSTSNFGRFDQTQYGGTAPPQGGWFIDNIEIIGDTLAGKPVQLRLRAGTDESTSTGGWEVDDVSVSGATYRRNVGVFPAELPAGAGPGRNVTFTGTLRNLADGVRRGLAVELVDVTLVNGQPPTVPLTLVPIPLGTGEAVVIPDDIRPRALVGGINLAPRGAVDFSFRVEVPEGASQSRSLLLRVSEYNDAAGTFLPVLDNEVEGFANVPFTFRIADTPELALGVAKPTPLGGRVGVPVALTLPVDNTGVLSVLLNGTCSVRRIQSHDPVNHRSEPDVVRYGPAVACTAVDAAPVAPPGRVTDVRFAFTPAERGYYEATMSVTSSVDGATPVPVGSPQVFRFQVDVPPLLMKEGVEDRAVEERWRIVDDEVPKSRWTVDESRAANGARSWRAGLSDAEFSSSAALSNTYTASQISTPTGWKFSVATPPLDLHNVTEGPLFLRFMHLPRLARFDGADVRIQVLSNEHLPESGWTTGSCRIRPVGGYDGPVWSYLASSVANNRQNKYAPDANGAFPVPDHPNYVGPDGWFASNDPKAPPNKNDIDANRKTVGEVLQQTYFTGFEESWRVAEFDLSDVECDQDSDPLNGNHLTALGHTVRFIFTVYTGAMDGDGNTCPTVEPNMCDPFSQRGRGQGWFIDDVHVSGYRLTLGPEGSATEYGRDGLPRDAPYRIRDNATKRFPSIVQNLGAYEDKVSVRVDEVASSTPPGAARVSVDRALLQPGNETHAWAEVGLLRDPGLLPLLYTLRLVAESGVDTNVQLTRDIELDFSPRRWPDLRVTMQPPSGPVQEGTRAFIPIRVENYGLDTAPSPRIVVIERSGGETKVHELAAENRQPIPSYFQDPLRSVVTVDFEWIPLPGRGSRTLTVVVDPDGLIEEYTKSDNTQTIVLEVSKLLQPDLSIGTDGLSLRVAGARLAPGREGDVLRYEVEANDVVTMDLRVRNDGPTGATNVDVRAFIGPLSLPPKTIPFIPAQSEVVVPFTWLAQKGDWTLQFTVRTSLVELDDENNRVPREGLVLLTVKGFDVTTSVSAPPKLVAPGEEFVANVTIANPGITGEELRLRAVLPEGWTGSFEQGIVFVARGRVGPAALTVPLHVKVGERAVAGEQLMTVQAVALDNPLKASTGMATVKVQAVYGVVASAETHATPPGRVDVPILVRNTGNSAEPIAVEATLPAGWRLAEAGPVRFSVAPYATETEHLAVLTPPGAATGRYDIPMTLTLPDGQTRSLVSTVLVREWRALSFEAAPTRTDAQDRIAIEVKVTNVGNVRAPFTLLTPDLPAGWTATVTPALGALAPGATMTVTLTVTPPAGVTSGEYDVPLYAHFDGVQPASLEGLANLDRIVVRVAKPDVALREFTYAPRLDVKPLQRLNVRGSVENRGAEEVRDLTVALFVDDVFMDRVVLPRLGPGERREVSLNWTTVGGEHAITVVADPFREVLESDRENNAATRVVVVEGEQQTVRGIPANTVDTPGPGALLGVLAAVGAALLAGRARRPGRSNK